MVTDVVMPRYSLTMQKGMVVKWLKKEGELVEKGEPLVEVEADKVTTEVESPASGVLLKICASEEAEVPVGQPLAFIGKLGETVPHAELVSEAEAARGEVTRPLEPGRRPERKEGKAEKVRASPLARSLAREHGIDLAQIEGTGPSGRITREDVLVFIELHRDARVVREILPIRGMQKRIAERMTQSIKTAAHCALTIEVEASRMISLRQRLDAKSRAEGKSGISYTDMLVKAVAMALKEYPLLNSALQDDQLRVFEDVNIGIAVEVESDGRCGLLVPVIRRADRKSLTEISGESRSLIERAKAGKASHNDLTGGTFTITNLGMYGVETFVPIINPPETAILGAGAIIEKPIFIRGEIEPRPLIHLTLSFDHRVVNGAPAARFLQRLKKILEEDVPEEQ